MWLPNNIDAALAPRREPDLWAEPTEPTEPTTKVSTLLVGPKPDTMFSAAHALGAALRAERRQGRGCKPAQDNPQTGAPPRIGLCSCGRLAGGWHVFDFLLCRGQITEYVSTTESIEAYHQRLADGIAALPRHRTDERADVPPFWRELAAYPGYEMHSVTREVRRVGKRLLQASNGSYSLSVNGERRNRGIQSLWEEVFPEHAKPANEKKVGEWAGEMKPHSPEPAFPGVKEWVADGGVAVINRPK